MGRKKEELMAELQEIVKQLQETQDEGAATMAAELVSGSLRGRGAGAVVQESRPQVSGRPRLRGKTMLFAALAVLLFAVGGWLVFVNATKPDQQTIVTGVRDLSTLATAEAYVMTTIEGHDNKLFGVDLSVNLPGTKRVYFFVVPAKLLAGVDLTKVSDNDVTVDAVGKRVSIVLPHATFIQEAIQMDKVRVFTDAGLFSSAFSAQEGVAKLSDVNVTEKLHQEATDMGILKTAEDNAVKAIQGLYKKMGYEVDVTFR